MQAMRGTIEREVATRHASECRVLDQRITRYQGLLGEALAQAREASQAMEAFKGRMEQIEDSQANQAGPSLQVAQARIRELEHQLTEADLRHDVALSAEKTRARELEKALGRVSEQLKEHQAAAQQQGPPQPHSTAQSSGSKSASPPPPATHSFPEAQEETHKPADPGTSEHTPAAGAGGTAKEQQEEQQLKAYLVQLFEVAAQARGSLELSGLAEVLALCGFGLGTPEIMQVLEAADKNRDGVIEPEEYPLVVQGMVAATRSGATRRTAPSSLPSQASQGGTRSSPLRAARSSSHSPDTAGARGQQQPGARGSAQQRAFVADLNRQFDAIDTNGDGKIDRTEFLRAHTARARSRSPARPATPDRRASLGAPELLVSEDSPFRRAQEPRASSPGPSKIRYSQRVLHGVGQAGRQIARRRSLSPGPPTRGGARRHDGRSLSSMRAQQQPQSIRAFQRARRSSSVGRAREPSPRGAKVWVPPSTRKMNGSLDTFCTRGYYDKLSGLP